MNYKMIGYVLGRIFLVEAGLLTLPLAVALLYGEFATLPGFLVPLVLLTVIGLALGLRTPKDTAIFAREGLVVVALSWVLMSLFAAMPFTISGEIPSFVDAFFEMVSGFTTTGSTILTDIEALSKGLLFWRSLSHWVGGMGVLVFTMAVLPMSDGRAMHLMRAEVPGPSVGKLSSKLRDTAKILYALYFVLTMIETVLLMLGGVSLYDALITSFGTAGTGGFSNYALSIGAFDSAYVEIVVTVFMLLFGINFNLYYFLLLRRFKEVFRSEELITYLIVVGVSTMAIAANVFSLYGSVSQSLRYAGFQVVSIITTTGYATADFNLWPTFSKTVLMLLMFFGGCAGSTAGGLKMARIIIMFKASMQDIQRVLHPHAVTTVRFEGKPLEEKTVRGVHVYLTIFILIMGISTLLISFDEWDVITSFTAVVTCLNNVGPGLELVGPMGGFAQFSPFAKMVLTFDMLVGRLEIFPMLVLISPSLWVKGRRKHGHVIERKKARVD